MPKIHYAIEVFTGSPITNTDYGLADGVFRFVTDRPQYDGSTVVPYYGPDEIDSTTGAGIGWYSNPNVFYEGFLQKSGSLVVHVYCDLA